MKKSYPKIFVPHTLKLAQYPILNSQQCHIYYSTALILRRQKSGNLDNLLDHTFKRKKELAGHGYLTKEVCNRALTYQVAQARKPRGQILPFCSKTDMDSVNKNFRLAPNLKMVRPKKVASDLKINLAPIIFFGLWNREALTG